MSTREGDPVLEILVAFGLLMACVIILGWEVGHNSRDIKHLKDIVKPGFAVQYEEVEGK